MTIDIALTDYREEIQNQYNPEQIFSDAQLSQWAEDNGFIKDDEKD